MNPRIDSYAWSGGREVMLRFGPEDGPVVVAALPLLEEANRTRTFVVTILRALAERGVGGVLPDLPGTGESLASTKDMRLADLRAAYAAAAQASGTRVFGLAVRSGALLTGDAELAGRWHLAPQMGDELLKEWRRIAGGPLEGDRVEVAGNCLSRELLDALPTSVLSARVVRLDADPRSADLKVDGTPLWRRAEPGNDPVLAQQLAVDIADWIATCAG